MDLRNYRLFISDVDGTLLNSNHELHPDTIQAFQALRSFGIDTTIATGKIFSSVSDLVFQLGISSPVILGQGAIIQDKDRNVLLWRGLPPEVAEIVFKASELYGCDLAVYMQNAILAKEYNYNLQLLTKYWEPKAEEVGEWWRLNERIEQIVKILFISRQSDTLLAKIERGMSETLSGMAAVQRSIPHVIEITNLLATKDRALQFLDEHLNIPHTQIIAAGDGENDSKMLAYAGCGVAVDNASLTVKQHADIVVGSNDENGVAKAIFAWLRTTEINSRANQAKALRID
jgi:hypothetical protein